MSAPPFVDVPLADVRPGDIAHHLTRELDPRPVVLVDHAASVVLLDILGYPSVPLELTNYRFTRRVDEPGPAS